MTNKVMVSSIIIAFLSLHAFSQDNFCKILGTSRDDFGRSFIKTKDFGYAIAGSSVSNISLAEDEDAYIIKLDSNFYLEWTRTIQNNDLANPGTSIYNLFQDAKGNYITIGTFNTSPSPGKMFVSKSDSTGALIWSKVIYQSNTSIHFDALYAGIEMRDGNYLITGAVLNNNAGSNDYDIPIIKLDSNGNIVTAKIIGARGAGNDEGANSMINTADGGIGIGGQTWSFGAGAYDFYLVKLDSNLNIEWTRTVGGTNYDVEKCLIQTSDRGYLMVGGTYIAMGSGGYDFYIVKLDSIGNLQWTKTVGGPNDEMALSCIQSNDGGYVVVGYTMSFGIGNPPSNGNAYIVKLDSAGNLQWAKTIGGTKDDFATSVLQDKDGGYLIAGYINFLLGTDSSDIFIAKLDSLGNGCCSENSSGLENSGGIVGSGGTLDTLSLFSLNNGLSGSRGTLSTLCITGINELHKKDFTLRTFINDGLLYIVIEGMLPGRYSINLFNTLGQIIITDKRTISQTIPAYFTYRVSSFTDGIYLVSIQSESAKISNKIIINTY